MVHRFDYSKWDAERMKLIDPRTPGQIERDTKEIEWHRRYPDGHSHKKEKARRLKQQGRT